MKKICIGLLFLASFALNMPAAFALQTPTATNANPVSQYSPVTQQLVDMVEHSPELKVLLLKSIAEGKRQNPDSRTNPAQSLPDFYAFVDRSIQVMPWEAYKDDPAIPFYDKTDQGLGLIYFISDIPLKELEGRGYYHNSIQYMEPYRSWLIGYVKAWGLFLDTEASWNEDYTKQVQAEPRFNLHKGWYEDPSNWKTFNQFFARYLKSPDMRPIAEPDNSAVVASPADSEPQGVWKIDSDSNLVQHEGVRVKSKVFNSIPQLLGPETAYAKAFAGGTLTHSFLSVKDYHRYHFPMSGVIKEMRIIPADNAGGGILTWDPKERLYILDSTVPGWQSIETRGCVILETPDFGLVALLPVGMSQVGSVNYVTNLKVGDTVKKGDPLGYFLFGGSDFVMIFQKDVAFSLTPPPNGSVFEHVLMGEEYGRVGKR